MVKRLRTYAALAGIMLSAMFSFAQAQPDQRCATMYMDSILRAQNPGRETAEQFENWLAAEIAAKNAEGKVYGGVYQIPVVVHVIHSGEAVGTGTNVSQAAIQSQIDVLNEDYRKMFGTNGWNNNAVGADCQIEFCLAQRRPDGTAFPAGAPGVNRILYSTITATAPPYSTTFIDATIKPWTYNNNIPSATRGWDPNKYLNLWLCDISGGILGYAQFPTSPLGGMGCGTQSAATDGVVFLYNSIGKSSVTGFPGPYNEGRTVTHEVGHWLGLRHIWGDGGCSVDDYCDDTPLAAAANFGCPAGTNSCTAAPDAGVDMIENYMDYTDDLCMNIFTEDQKMRMRTVLESTPMRVNLINSDACTPPNPSDASITDIFNPIGDNCPGSITPSVQIKNRGSNTLTSATISYKIDNGTATSFSWTGSVAPGNTATVSLPAFTAAYGNHVLTAWSTLPNGVTDPYTLYDTSSIPFVVSTGIMPNYTEDFESGNFPPDLRWNVVNSNADCYEWIGASGMSAAGTFINNIAEVPCYGNSSTSPEYLYTPIFTLPCGATSATLNFKVAYRKRVSTSADALSLEISTDCGATYTQIWTANGTALAQSTTLTGSAEYFPTVSTDWKSVSQSIQSYVSPTLSGKVRFRFKGVSNNGNNIFIDDVTFSATLGAEANVQASGNDVLDEGYFDYSTTNVGTPVTQTFTVQNTGSSTLTLTGPINVTGTGFALGSTFGTTTLAAGASTTFTVTFTPTGAGAYSGNVSFGTNDCDEGTYNFILMGTGQTVPPVAGFTASPTTVCSGSPVAFTNTSTNATSYSWTFTGGTPSTSTAANPTVTWSTPGTYNVSLTATNAYGNNTYSQTGYITVLNGSGVSLPITEGFTSTTFPPAGWSINNNNNSPTTWVRTTAAGNTPTTGNSMMFDNYNYNDSDDDEVQVTAFTLSGMVAAQLQFDVAYAPYNTTYDGLQVFISTDCGVTYNSIYLKSGTTLATAASMGSIFTPTAAQWRTETVSLTPYAGMSSVIVKFRNLSNYGNRIFVDNINITGTPGTVAPVAGFTATPTTVCAGGTVTYTNTSTNSPTSYSWSFPGGTPSTSTATNPTVTYSTAGTYNVSLTATNAGGSNTSTQTNYITVNANVTPTFTNPGPVCSGTSFTLPTTSNNGITGTWSPAVNNTATTTYTFTPTAGQCATTATMTVTVNPTPATPTITAGGPTTFCSGGSVTLTSSSATGNTWSTGATTQSITVSASGTYTVTVTSGSCSSTSTGTAVTVSPTPATPTITAGGPTTFCSGGSVTLTSSSATGNTWSTGATTQSITVAASGTYTVTVTSGSCSATSAGTTVTVNPSPATPTITAGGPTTFCTGGSVVLTSSVASGNNWSTGATTQSITVSTSGTYTVSVTSGSCTSTSAGTVVTVNAGSTTPTFTNPGPICSGASLTLPTTSTNGITGSWSPAVNNTATTTYTFTPDPAQCATTTTMTVTVNPNPSTPTITAGGSTTFCSGGSVILTSSSTTGNTWSTGATSQSITVSTGGTYTVTVTSGGCSSTSTGTAVTVNPNPATPTITAGGPTTFCTGGSVVLTSSSATGNAWSTGATTQSITVSASGTYTVTVTSGSCSATSIGTTVTVSPTTTPATFSAVGPYCNGDAFTLPVTSNEGFTGTWSPAVNNTATTTYTFAVDAGQCASDGNLTVTINNPVTATFAAQGPYCPGTSFTLPATSNEGFTGTWSPAIDNMNTTTYTFTVDAGQCANDGAATVVISSPAAPTVTASGPTTFCSGGNVVLTSSAASGNTWSNGMTTQSITVTNPGTYTVTETSGGCTSGASAPITVTVNPSPTVSFGAIASMCVYNDPVTLTQGSPAGGVYSGNGVSGGMFDPNVAGLGTSTLTYTVTAPNSCSSSATSNVIVDACLGLDENAASVVSVYPNPTTGIITVDADKDVLTEITAYDALGKLLFVLKPNATKTQLDFTGYASGVYNVKIATQAGVQHIPVSVNY